MPGHYYDCRNEIERFKKIVHISHNILWIALKPGQPFIERKKENQGWFFPQKNPAGMTNSDPAVRERRERGDR